jgi:hypothetical protein
MRGRGNTGKGEEDRKESKIGGLEKEWRKKSNGTESELEFFRSPGIDSKE